MERREDHPKPALFTNLQRKIICYVQKSQDSETKNQPKEEVFGRTSLRTSRQKLRLGPPSPGKTSIWHRDAARTSAKKLRSEKLRTDFLFPKEQDSYRTLADFCPAISRRSGSEKFHEKILHNLHELGDKVRFAARLWELGGAACGSTASLKTTLGHAPSDRIKQRRRGLERLSARMQPLQQQRSVWCEPPNCRSFKGQNDWGQQD